MSGQRMCYCLFMNELLCELVEKYEDVLACAEDWEERNLVSEFLDDLKELSHCGE